MEYQILWVKINLKKVRYRIISLVIFRYIFFVVFVNGILKLLNNIFNKMSIKLILFVVYFNINNNIVLGFMYRNNDYDWNYVFELI